MKKYLFLPLFAIAVFSMSAYAEHCTYGGAAAYCDWGTGCYTINNDYAPNVGTACATLITNCETNGSVYTNVPSSALTEANGYGEGVNCGTAGGTWVGGKDPSQAGARGYCNWGTCVCSSTDDYSCTDGGCFEINDDTELADCQQYATVLTSKSQCPTASLPRAEGGTCSASSSGGSDNSGNNNNGGSGNQNTSVGFAYSPANLTVLVQAGNLHISSLKDAKVSLYSMNGKHVFSQNVSAGYETVNLSAQKQGVYYAVVLSGSSKKTVRVVLK